MIIGVIHKRLETRLWKLLYYQGLLWISAAILTELPGVVCHPFFECCLVHRTESFCFTIQVMPFLNINGEQIWTYLEFGYSRVQITSTEPWNVVSGTSCFVLTVR
jgi:hypothetical protein